MTDFANGGIFLGPKIRHFRGFTVLYFVSGFISSNLIFRYHRDIISFSVATSISVISLNRMIFTQNRHLKYICRRITRFYLLLVVVVMTIIASLEYRNVTSPFFLTQVSVIQRAAVRLKDW